MVVKGGRYGMQYRTVISIVVMALGFSSPAAGQIIQLPTFVYFAPSTSVLVPDGGSAHLGSVGRAGYGHVSRGVPGLGKVPGIGRLFRNQSISSHVRATTSSVHVTVIDLAAMDRAVLEAAKKRHTAPVPDPRALAIEQQIKQGPGKPNRTHATSDRGGSLASVAEIHRRNTRQRKAEQQEASQLFAKGRQAEADGKPGVARIFYRMAARQADRALQEKILARLDLLSVQKQ